MRGKVHVDAAPKVDRALVIILSVVIFGGLWGFWGVFFAIPLATLIKAVVHAWPDGLAVDD